MRDPTGGTYHHTKQGQEGCLWKALRQGWLCGRDQARVRNGEGLLLDSLGKLLQEVFKNRSIRARGAFQRLQSDLRLSHRPSLADLGLETLIDRILASLSNFVVASITVSDPLQLI